MITVAEIRRSKKYKDLSPKVIARVIKGRPEADVKEIKTELHRLYGAFQTTKKARRERLLSELENKYSLEIVNQILATNRSSKERISAYNSLYKKIFSITGKPKIILDLGAGLNPISYPYIYEAGAEPLYYAYDVNEADRDFINRYFKIIGAKGKAEIFDLRADKGLQKADVCFLFKTIDVIEDKGHKVAEDLITSLGCKWVVVSFAIKTLSGRKMRYAYRGWFERMCERLALRYEKIETENEIFYIVKK